MATYRLVTDNASVLRKKFNAFQDLYGEGEIKAEGNFENVSGQTIMSRRDPIKVTAIKPGGKLHFADWNQGGDWTDKGAMIEGEPATFTFISKNV